MRAYTKPLRQQDSIAQKPPQATLCSAPDISLRPSALFSLRDMTIPDRENHFRYQMGGHIPRNLLHNLPHERRPLTQMALGARDAGFGLAGGDFLLSHIL